MMLQEVPDEIMCRAFPITLKGKPHSIGNFKELSKNFVSYFIAGQKYSKPSTYLLTVKQGVQLVKTVGAKSIAVISGSQLVVGQLNGEYETKEENIEKYLKLVRELVKGFQAFSISQVPREENVEVDQLVKLAMANESLIPNDVMMQYLEAPSIVKSVEEL
ncbi:hypothetical protein Vadar_029886 [Vaccinium darrowii]|uniref:Uncharacterized protein n=1 Tax=Vaccinium darrowii TaxID=229202 RepID=A0ACB7Z7C9_9ERIC|nr:hypothetical protein Vadar_029886 [Vaccinium darrowii]